MDDVLKLVEPYLSDDNQRRWAKLSSDVHYRRLEILLLSEILVELRKLNQKPEDSDSGPMDS